MQQPSVSVWCLSFLYYISMVAIAYFIIARATLTPTPHSLLFILCRYAGQTEGKRTIAMAAWFTTVWEAVKRSIVFTWVCFWAWASAFLRVGYTQEMKSSYAIQHHRIGRGGVCVSVSVSVFAVIPACQMTKLHQYGHRQLQEHDEQSQGRLVLRCLCICVFTVPISFAS